MPYLAAEVDELTFNTQIKVTAPKALNSFILDDSFIRIKIDNLSDQTWYLSILEDIQIFRYENNAWVEIEDKTAHLGATEFILSEAGDFPDDSIITSISPDLNSDAPVALRIFVLAHDESRENSTGTFVDVQLKP